MATNAQIYDLRWGDLSVLLRQRVMGSVLKQAEYITNEDPAASYHKARFEWAQRAIRDSGAAANVALSYVALNGAIQTAELDTPGTATDNDIDYVVASILPTLVVLS